MYGYGYQYSAIISGGGNPAAAIFAAYKTRVLADGGVVENDACTIAFLESIGAGIIPSFSFLLDTYSGAAAAYSLRKLRNAYSGDAIRVRRSSDNAELNIGFVSNELDTASLTTFCSGTNGFVTTWYDQSGNGINATQTTAANQPQIVSSGALLTLNGKPKISLDGTNDFLSISSFNYAASNYNSFVGSRDVAGRRLFGLAGTGGLQYLFGLLTDNKYYLQNNTPGYQLSDATDTTIAQVLLTGLRDGAGTQIIYKNSNVIASTIIALSMNNAINSIGLYSASIHSHCNLQEIIYYNLDNSTNRAAIETNINTYYGVY